MARGRCQICARKTPLKVDGRLRHHHVRSLPCAGTGQLPLEEDDGFLVQEAARLHAAAADRRALVRDLVARRVNYIDPVHAHVVDQLEERAAVLDRRLKRLRTWPARYNRNMMERGWSDVPYPYLLKRENSQ